MAEPTLIERLRGEARMWGPQVNLTVLGAALHKLLTEAADALERHSLLGGAAGYRLVPEEPTGDMWVAGRKVFENEAELYRAVTTTAMAMARADRAPEKIYAAMLAASAPPPSVWMDRTALEIAVQNRHGMIVNIKDLSDTWRRVAERLETEKQAVETEREACAKALRG